MTSLSNPGGPAIDMTAWVAPNCPASETGVGSNATATSLYLYGPGLTLTVVGTGFTYHIENDPPFKTYTWTGGTVTGFTSSDISGPGHLLYTISGLHLSQSDFYALLAQPTLASYQAMLFDGADTLMGTQYDDTLLALAGDDDVKGGNGNDVLSGGVGNDRLEGQGGRDIADYSEATGVIAVDLGLTGTAQSVGGGQGADTLTGIEGVRGGKYADTLIGTSAANTFDGMDGNDNIDASAGGSDSLLGGLGNDTFNFGGAFGKSDTVYGGEGNDTIVLDGDYSAGLKVSPAMTADVERLLLDSGHDYNFTFTALVTTSVVDARQLTTSDHLTLNGAEARSGLTVYGGAGDDIVKGSAYQPTIAHLENGGTDTITGAGYGSTYYFGGALTGDDFISGLGTLDLNGDYSHGSTINAVHLQSIILHPGHDYDLSLGSAFSNYSATVDASALSKNDTLHFNGSAGDVGLNNAQLNIIGGHGDDYLVGNGQSSSFDLTKGGNDTVVGALQPSAIYFGTTFTADDHIIGGGHDSLWLDHHGALVLDSINVSGISVLRLQGAHNYALEVHDGVFNDASQYQIWVGYNDPRWLDNAYTFKFDGSNLSQDSRFWTAASSNIVTLGAGDDYFQKVHYERGNDVIHGGAGDDTIGGHGNIYGGVGDDTLSGGGRLLGQDCNDTLELLSAGTADGGAGDDTITPGIGTVAGGQGNDLFDISYGAAVQDGAYGTVTDFDPAHDTFRFFNWHRGPLTGIDPIVTTGKLDDGAAFYSELQSDLDASKFGAMHAVLFRPDSGSLAGQLFLVVDAAGHAGIDGDEYVIHLGGTSSVAGLSLANFLTW